MEGFAKERQHIISFPLYLQGIETHKPSFSFFYPTPSFHSTYKGLKHTIWQVVFIYNQPFHSTYKGLKLENSLVVSACWLAFHSTYKGLKLSSWELRFILQSPFHSTYKGLKRRFQSVIIYQFNTLSTLPTRDWNRFSFIFSKSSVALSTLPTRDWNNLLLSLPLPYSSLSTLPTRDWNTYKPSVGLTALIFPLYLQGIETRLMLFVGKQQVTFHSTYKGLKHKTLNPNAVGRVLSTLPTRDWN